MSQSSSLQHCLTYSFGGIIWKIKTSPLNTLIAVESRDASMQTPSFSVFDFASAESYFKEQTFESPMNLSLWHLSSRHMVLNAWESNQLPETKGMLVIEVSTGKLLWERYHVVPQDANESGIQVFDPRIQPRRFSWLSYEHAEPISGQSSEEADADILFPFSDPEFSLPGFILHGEITGQILSLTDNFKTFVSFHEVNQGFLQQRLLVYQSDRILLDEILASGIQNLQPEAFFIHKKHLFFVRNKQEINTYLT